MATRRRPRRSSRRRPRRAPGCRSRPVALAALLSLLLSSCGGAEPRPVEPSAATSDDATAESTRSAGEQPSAPQRRRPAATLRPLSQAEQAALDERLRRAAWANQVQRAETLIARGADVNAKDETQQSAYLIATSEGYLELLWLTLAHGADVDAKDSFNGTGLIRAAERGHHRVVRALLRAGIDRDHVNRLGYQAIHEAVWLGEDTPTYVQTVRTLARGGVRLDRPSDREGLTPLEMAEQRGHDGQAAVLRRALDGGGAGPDGG